MSSNCTFGSMPTYACGTNPTSRKRCALFGGLGPGIGIGIVAFRTVTGRPTSFPPPPSLRSIFQTHLLRPFGREPGDSANPRFLPRFFQVRAFRIKEAFFGSLRGQRFIGMTNALGFDHIAIGRILLSCRSVASMYPMQEHSRGRESFVGARGGNQILGDIRRVLVRLRG